MKLRRILSLFLVFVLVFNFAANVSASARTLKKTEQLYNSEYELDGITYSIEIDEDYNITISGKSGKSSGKLVLDSDLTGTIQISSGLASRATKYTVTIDELNPEESICNVTMVDSKTKLTESLSYSDIIKDEYVGQVAATVTLSGTISVATLLAVLLLLSLAVIVSGVIYYAVEAVISAVKKVPNTCYKAYHGRSVYISRHSISFSAAVKRIKNRQDTYTYNKATARSIVQSTGYGCTSAEIDKNWQNKVGIYFYHFHTANRNGAHSFYGTPHFGK